MQIDTPPQLDQLRGVAEKTKLQTLPVSHVGRIDQLHLRRDALFHDFLQLLNLYLEMSDVTVNIGVHGFDIPLQLFHLILAFLRYRLGSHRVTINAHLLVYLSKLLQLGRVLQLPLPMPLLLLIHHGLLMAWCQLDSAS